MPIVSCRICHVNFYIRPSHQKRGFGKYCSRKCQFKGQLKGSFKQCWVCKKEVWKMPKELKHSKSGKFFCGKSCQTIWRNSEVYIGPNHFNWKDGINTYRKILARNKIQMTCKRCLEKDSRILAVHHIDKNRRNNEINNLVWLCYNCHFLIHHNSDEMKKFMETLV